MEQASLFSYSQVSHFVPGDYPPRRIRALVDAALDPIAGTLTVFYARSGRLVIAPERVVQRRQAVIAQIYCLTAMRVLALTLAPLAAAAALRITLE